MGFVDDKGRERLRLEGVVLEKFRGLRLVQVNRLLLPSSSGLQTHIILRLV